MHNLINILIRICLFQAKPQDLPTAQQLAIASGVVLALIGAFGGNISLDENIDTGSMTLFSFAHVITLGALVWLVLHNKGLAERWYQSITALYGTQALLTLLTMPMISWHARLAGGLVFDENFTPSLPLFVAAMLAFWSFAVAIYILRITFETTWPRALALTISLFIVSNIIPSILVPR